MKYVDPSSEYINLLQTYECGNYCYTDDNNPIKNIRLNVEIRTEAALFPEKEYISEIFLAVQI